MGGPRPRPAIPSEDPQREKDRNWERGERKERNFGRVKGGPAHSVRRRGGPAQVPSGRWPKKDGPIIKIDLFVERWPDKCWIEWPLDVNLMAKKHKSRPASFFFLPVLWKKFGQRQLAQEGLGLKSIAFVEFGPSGIGLKKHIAIQHVDFVEAHLPAPPRPPTSVGSAPEAPDLESAWALLLHCAKNGFGSRFR